MFIAKPHKKGAVVELDASGKQENLTDLTASGIQDPKLLNAQDYGEYGNPDGASGNVAARPDFRMTPDAGDIRGQNVSGRGNLQKTARTTAPMSNPFPAPSSSVRTTPSTIKE